MPNYEQVIEQRKVFLINESRKNIASFNNNQRYFINVSNPGNQLKELLLKGKGASFKI